MANYRKNAGIVVFNAQKKVLMCQRTDKPDAWQFPQGGIETNETPLQAALRELKEETSIVSVKHVKTLSYAATYNFPATLGKKLRYGSEIFDGQAVYWSLFFFFGQETEINLQTDEPEFCKFYWADFADACKKVVDFKKDVYKTAYQEFAPLIEQWHN